MKRRIIQVIIIVISSVFLAWFLIPVFTSVGWKIGNVTGVAVFAVLLLYGIFFDRVNSFLKELWKKKWGKFLEILAAVILAVIFSLAAVTYGCILSASNEKPVPGETAVVLGCKVNGTVPSLTLVSRLETAWSYLSENPEAMCIVCGGMGDGESVTEADAMREWLIREGISPDRIFIEDQSLDTDENLRFAREILLQNPELGESICIITNDFHMYRALSCAKSLGLEASGISASTPWWLYPTYVVREMYGILENWFLK